MISNFLKLLNVNLKLFDGGAAGSGGGSSAGATAAPTGSNTSQPGVSRQAKGDSVKVVYGKQPEASTESQKSEGNTNTPTNTKDPVAEGQTKTELTPEERKAQFESMISGDYKDLFGERIQGIIDKRFKETKLLEGQLGALKPALDILMDRYKVGDVSKLAEAVLSDDAYLEDLADQAGMSVEQYKRVKTLEAENETLKKKANDEEAQKLADQQVSKWYEEADTLKGIYPNLDLRKEVQNPQFMSLLKSGVSVKAAYEVVHIDDIKTNVAKTTAKTVEQNVTANIQAKGMRPPENGTNNQTGVIVKNDVRQLSKADRLEIAKRAQRGERITF